jgi:hypothetical protein
MATLVKYRRKWIVIVLVTLLVSTVMVVTALASDDSHAGKRSNGSRQNAVNSKALASVTLSGKTPRAVFTRTGGMYTLSDTIVIVDESGSKIKLDRLRLPSEADVIYIVEQGHRLAVKIQVTSVSKDASEAFMVENQLE